MHRDDISVPLDNLRAYDKIIEKMTNENGNPLSFDNAIMAEEKFTHYLFADSGKSTGFVERLGYSLSGWTKLRDDLLHASINSSEASVEYVESQGVKFIYNIMDFKDGYPVTIVWQIDRGSTSPRLITAYVNTGLLGKEN